MFPRQFETKLSWNATLEGQEAKDTNYIMADIKIDHDSSRMVVDTNFATLSLQPHDLVSYILDFNQKQVYLKSSHQNKKYCIYYDIALNHLFDLPMELNNLPNIAEIFDLFPYIMYLKEIKEIEGRTYNIYKYSNPLKNEGNAT